MRIGFEAKRVFHNNTGLGNYGRDVIRILKEHSPICNFLLYNTKPPKTKRIENSRNIETIYPISFFWKKFSSLWRLGPVIKQIKNDHLDIYHGLSGEVPYGLKKNNVPTVVTIHDLIFLSHPQYYSFFDRFIYKKKFNHAVHKADKVIAISEQTKRDIIKYLNIDKKKIEVIYQGCNNAFKETYGDNEKEEVKDKYNLPLEFILNVGTIEERKNVLTLVKAIKDTGFHLILVGGEKGYATKVHNFIKENNMQSQVSFLKNVPTKDLAIIYQLATVFCYPSLCEGFGIPIIEALFSGLPVITTNFGCFPEAAGPTSLYVDPTDQNQIKTKIKQLFNDPELRTTMKISGLAYVQKFSDENVAKNLMNLYKKVL
ncbi:glycosyltransferase family 4 protein [Maribacter ulvicola]|uniref:Glycosyltransferase involved in cell wall bisynthesis n=1 Tax=Maribacter ulvicola TaxID=228959 RepID=A0A1N6SDU0_9FLAO|nr:glycosyltransferase family 1 protein [Maribacter ulvicola]SIQ39167.1 Glycosyltransferase involved in cell wall bisynthesis [Maribacter ulvicola]